MTIAYPARQAKVIKRYPDRDVSHLHDNTVVASQELRVQQKIRAAMGAKKIGGQPDTKEKSCHDTYIYTLHKPYSSWSGALQVDIK